MSKSLRSGLAVWFAALSLAVMTPAAAQDAEAGSKVFRKCAACHAVGDGAKNRVGPELNALFGRTAGSIEGFRYSKAMVSAGADGLVWNEETITGYLRKPRAYLKGTNMAFAGLKKDRDIANVMAYLRTYSSAVTVAEPAPSADASAGEKTTAKRVAAVAADRPLPTHGTFHLGRVALPEEIAAWDIDVRPDGAGLPPGRGTVAEGGELYDEQCAICHGVFGEGEGRWPVLAGGEDTLTDERPVKTIGSYWPYLSTVYDYVHRAMPFGYAQSLSDDEVYAITAYLLYLNDVVTDEDFELSDRNFTSVRLPNENNFFMDDRHVEPHYAAPAEPCMSDCKPEPATITMRARVLDVTPEGDDDAGAGAID